MEVEKLTLQLAKDQVKRIECVKEDDEAAHSAEDYLHQWFINSVSLGLYDSIDEAVEVSKEILKTEDIDFARWCA